MRSVTLPVSLITGWSFWHISVSWVFDLQRRSEQFDLYHFIKSPELACHTMISATCLQKAREKKKGGGVKLPSSVSPLKHHQDNLCYGVHQCASNKRGPQSATGTKSWLGGLVGRGRVSWVSDDRSWAFQIFFLIHWILCFSIVQCRDQRMFSGKCQTVIISGFATSQLCPCSPKAVTGVNDEWVAEFQHHLVSRNRELAGHGLWAGLCWPGPRTWEDSKYLQSLRDATSRLRFGGNL